MQRVGQEDGESSARAKTRQQKPRRAVACQRTGLEGAYPDREGDEQDRAWPSDPIADRVRKIRGNRRRVAADRVQDRIECKAGAQRRGTQTCYGTVEPRRDSHSGNMLAGQEYERDIDNGIETQPEQIEI